MSAGFDERAEREPGEAEGDERETVGFGRRSAPPALSGPAQPPEQEAAEGKRERPDVRLTPGRLLPGTRYRLERWLGSGAMGTVFEAKQIDIDRPVAVKILNASQSRNHRAAAGFHQEARASAQIGAPNIVDVLDFGSLPDGRLYMVMELLRGDSLALVVSDGALDLGRGVAILRQMCKALAAAHRAGLIHRDVKPENVFLIDRDGRPDFVKVLDFGVAHHIGQVREGRPIGTPAYMAPEHIKGDDFDGRVDMYAFGCTACEVLTGQLPFEAESIEDQLLEHLDTVPVVPTLRGGRKLPPVIDAVLLRCLAKDPDDRFENMDELEAALCEAQIQLGITTGWDDLPAPSVEVARREAIERGLKALVVGRVRRKAWPWAVGLVATLGLGAIAWASSRGDAAEATVSDAVTDLVRAAKDAASRAIFVYPPAEEPEVPTAYTHVLELEVHDGERARTTADGLRQEFSATLVRLGDEYWERPGGRPFAIDYYVQALVFRPDDPHARKRAMVTIGELADLRMKASQSGFSQSDLAAAEPLRALATSDPSELPKALARRRARKRSSATGGSRVSAVVEVLDDPGDVAPEAILRGAGDDFDSPVSAPTPEPSGPVDKEVTEEKRDVALSRRRTEEGLSALRTGDFATAEQLLHSALAADSRNVSALAGLGTVYFERGDFPKAVKFYEKATRRGGRKSSRLRLQLGDAYFKVERYNDARAQYEKARELGSSEASARITKLESRLGR